MAVQSSQLLSSVVYDNNIVTANGEYVLATVEWTNSNKLPNCRVVVDYEAINPNLQFPGSFLIAVVVEGEREDMGWYPIAYQYEPFTRLSDGAQRIIFFGPSIASGQGIDDIVYPANRTEARISKEQSAGAAKMRLKIRLVESDYTGLNAFQSVTISAYVEMFD